MTNLTIHRILDNDTKGEINSLDFYHGLRDNRNFSYAKGFRLGTNFFRFANKRDSNFSGELMKEAEILTELLEPENRAILKKIIIEELRDLQIRLDNVIEILESIAREQ